jgi:hypothetical protein
VLIGIETEDHVSINFRICYEIEDICTFNFGIIAKIDVFTYENDEVWISHKALERFIKDLEKLNSSLREKAEVSSQDENLRLSIETYGHHGYLLVRIFIRYQTKTYFQLHSTYNIFEGGFFVEPANLSNWLTEFKRIFIEKEPSTDFLGEWNTTLPIPERLKNITDKKDK